MGNYVIGLDYGTDSVRAILVDTSDGKTLNSKVVNYSRWAENKYCDSSKNQFRQHLLDHIEGMELSIKGILESSGVNPQDIKGICVDTTGSSPIPVDEEGTALCLKEGFEENPNAMMVLWKDHTSIKEADEINHLATTWGGEDFTRFEGGIYSSEWFWAKILHVIREDSQVKQAAWSWVEHCDLMTYILTGGKDLSNLKRSRCAAGHKAMWHESWGGLPDEAFLNQLDPYLGVLKGRLYEKTFTSDEEAGKLSQEWADKLGLSTDTVIAVGTFDAHAGAVGAEVEEFTLVRVMGTSTCDIIVSSEGNIGKNTVKGICGQVNGSVIPGMIGLEAGQSAFGDVLAWFRDIVVEPTEKMIQRSKHIAEESKQKLIEELKSGMIEELSTEAQKLPIGQADPVALDWVNGRRTPDANQSLKAAIANLSLGTKAPHIFKSLVEAICFGSKKIIDRFREEHVVIKSVVGIGGVAKKSPYIMQTLADVLNMPIKVAVSDQAPALGAAIYAAAASGVYSSTEEAIKKMGNGFEETYYPKEENVKLYEEIYQSYLSLGQFVETNLAPHES